MLFLLCACVWGHMCVLPCVCFCLRLFQPRELKSRTNQKLPDSTRPYPMWTLRTRGQLVEREKKKQQQQKRKEKKGGGEQKWKEKRMLWLQGITHDFGKNLCQKSLLYDQEEALDVFSHLCIFLWMYVPYICVHKKTKSSERTYSPQTCVREKIVNRTTEEQRAVTQNNLLQAEFGIQHQSECYLLWKYNMLIHFLHIIVITEHSTVRLQAHFKDSYYPTIYALSAQARQQYTVYVCYILH